MTIPELSSLVVHAWVIARNLHDMNCENSEIYVQDWAGLPVFEDLSLDFNEVRAQFLLAKNRIYESRQRLRMFESATGSCRN